MRPTYLLPPMQRGKQYTDRNRLYHEVRQMIVEYGLNPEAQTYILRSSGLAVRWWLRRWHRHPPKVREEGDALGVRNIARHHMGAIKTTIDETTPTAFSKKCCVFFNEMIPSWCWEQRKIYRNRNALVDDRSTNSNYRRDCHHDEGFLVERIRTNYRTVAGNA